LWGQLEPKYFETKKKSAFSRLIRLIKYNIKKKVVETNIAKNISPRPKGLMGFISFGGAIFLFGGLSPPKPMPGDVPA